MATSAGGGAAGQGRSSSGYSRTKETLAQNSKQELSCPRCGPGPPLEEDYKQGDVVCTQCGGVVMDRVLDVGSEWRTFSNDGGREKDPNRVGRAESKSATADMSIKVGATANQGNFESGLQRSNMHSPLNTSDRSFLRNAKELGNLAARLDISDQCVLKAKQLFKLACDAGSLKGQKSEAVAAACLFLACRLKKVGRSLNEIQNASGVPKKKINKSFKAITLLLNIRLEAATATNFTGRYTNGLGLDRKVAMLAEHVAKTAKEMLIVEGRVPTSTVAAAIYMAVLVKGKGAEVTPGRIVEVAGVGEATIRDTYRDMYPAREYLFAGTKIEPGSLRNLRNWGATRKPDVLEKAIKWAKENGKYPLAAKLEPGVGGSAVPGPPPIKSEPGAPMVKPEPL